MMSKQQNGIEFSTDGISIDFTKMSDVEIDIVCRNLRDSIHRLLSDPKEKADYEQWKRELVKKRDCPHPKGQVSKSCIA